ncbi:MAG TPA: thioredoxin domain-containing protein [Methylomirabilota bacterium]|nr:thioredoxin domain-containing protein [Methylomirabilota bacterium]
MRIVPRIVVALYASVVLGFAQAPAPKPTQPASNSAPSPEIVALQKKIEAFLRRAYAWGPEYKIEIGPLNESGIADLYAVNVKLDYAGQTDSTVLYVSKDGRYMVRGPLQDMSIDPNAETRNAIHIGDSPAKGPADAPIMMVEYADYECPACRQFNLLLPDILNKNPQVRLVFKDYPLADIHPWAMTAATAARCVHQLSPGAYWKFHDSIFDSQDLISPSNAWDKLLDLASQIGVSTDSLKACMVDPATTKAIEDEVQQDEILDLTSTPTIFVNGRRVVGPNAQLLQQYIDYELSHRPTASPKAPPNPAPTSH